MDANYRGLFYSLEKSIKKKKHLLDASVMGYGMRAMLATLFLTLGTSIAVITAQYAEGAIPGSGKFLYSFMFSWSLIMIIYMNAELGTSNMMYTTVAVHRKFLSFKNALILLFTCLFFNLIGGIIFSYLVSLTSIFQDLPADHFLFSAIEGKLGKTPLQIFTEGILANVIVNTAVFSTIRMKDDAGKVIAMVFIIFIFAFLGFEHLIANFSSFPLAYFSANSPIVGMTISGVLTNFLFAGLGNFVGGGLIIGLSYSWLNRKSPVYQD
ncbi:MAG: formate/nitrite transporter family protein [Alkalibacterium sp.]|uniref:formate/nitrite transporter family protein n=1 Tax=Alkalibacterium TaxID=99906 RepID=UPI0026474A41|nr:formate/nitrite transporter family protein [Alkalibacterium sp.]MDN6293825.1 formate/nitrite transporter family protein [Alkalibacterium sp.]MDN6295018.1 formate/nitrite transporter family protein [Alkalibacterium sp.]MDN6326886.1 formate/nitrite transporter family protein [Alkalibacterium sp.]